MVGSTYWSYNIYWDVYTISCCMTHQAIIVSCCHFVTSLFSLCPGDNSQGALCFAPICLSAGLSVGCTFKKSLCNQLLPEFSSNQFETLHRCYKHIEDVHVTFCRRKNNFWQNYGIFDLDNFEVRFQYEEATSCNQLLPGFSSNQLETLHRCYKQNYCIFDLDNFEVRFQYRVATLCNQLLSEFSSIQFEILHRYYKHIEDVHMTFCTQKYNFDKITAILTDFFRH